MHLGLVATGWLALHVAQVFAQGNTVCRGRDLDWYTNAIGETPCKTYERLRQICDRNYRVGEQRVATPPDACDSPQRGCCCNSVSWALSMLCLNCQQNLDSPNGIDAGRGAYQLYLSAEGGQSCTPTNKALPQAVQSSVCQQDINIFDGLYELFWDTGDWFYTFTRQTLEQAFATRGNGTFSTCPDRPTVSPTPSSSSTSSFFSSTSTSSGTSTSGSTTTPLPSPNTSAGTGTSSNDKATPSTSESDEAGLGTGAIVGIALGVVCAICIFVFLAFCLFRRRQEEEVERKDGYRSGGYNNERVAGMVQPFNTQQPLLASPTTVVTSTNGRGAGSGYGYAASSHTGQSYGTQQPHINQPTYGYGPPGPRSVGGMTDPGVAGFASGPAPGLPAFPNRAQDSVAGSSSGPSAFYGDRKHPDGPGGSTATLGDSYGYNNASTSNNRLTTLTESSGAGLAYLSSDDDHAYDPALISAYRGASANPWTDDRHSDAGRLQYGEEEALKRGSGRLPPLYNEQWREREP